MDIPRVACVLPCFRCRDQILEVLQTIGPEISKIYVVDDACPEKTGQHVEESCKDERVTVLKNSINLGVGGATIVGYRQALRDNIQIVVKLDGDGQMEGAQIPNLVAPIQRRLADYTKGNRFYNLGYLRPMPLVRLLGNCALSFISKLSGGYWGIMDPTNGFTAIHANVLRALELDKIEKRYFFESDMLYRLYLLRAVIWDVPLPAKYGNEQSSLNVRRALIEFSLKHANRISKRIFYSYFLRDFQVGSLMLLAGFLLCSFGIGFGSYHWYWGHRMDTLNSPGTIMLAALPTLMGFQLLLNFINCDMNNVPNRVIHPALEATSTTQLLVEV